ncbi:hypothetical protein GWI33_001476 [Rhynchophorus ferrugineus]|uniref:Uncharacterized protein n=1 Tax=Rhynchophorus ferrugineus TaxID=354439 RepID=A0A834ILC6_RHYFE|nr:hypothetical protein GWI33_001476 [Rhynchophorus ferrugineus]
MDKYTPQEQAEIVKIFFENNQTVSITQGKSYNNNWRLFIPCLETLSIISECPEVVQTEYKKLNRIGRQLIMT